MTATTSVKWYAAEFIRRAFHFADICMAQWSSGPITSGIIANPHIINTSTSNLTEKHSTYARLLELDESYGTMPKK